MTNNLSELQAPLDRIATALEAFIPKRAEAADLDQHSAYVWEAKSLTVKPVPHVSRIPLYFLCGIDRNVSQLLQNTQQFANGYAANNVLLWGARGMGKSSLVKAVHAEINEANKDILVLVEVHREDLPTLSPLLDLLRQSKRRFLLFCDDLSFDEQDQSYKSLKALLEGGLEGRPDNVLFYATSNRRHLLKRDMIENEQSTALHPSEAVEEKVSLSDRFGLWLGFHNCSQEDYFNMIRGYAKALKLNITDDNLIAQAREWQVTRGSRSGRVAWQFIQDLAGKHHKDLTALLEN